MAKAKSDNVFKVYRKGQEVTEAALKSQFGDRYLDVLGAKLKQLPKVGKTRPKYTVQEDLPPTKGEYDRMRQKRFTTSVDSLISDAFGEIESLADEMREAFDNTPESLQGSGAGEARGEAADTLENLHGDQPDVPEVCAEMSCVFIPSKDLGSRPKRASGVQDMLTTAAGEIRQYIEDKQEEEEGKKDEDKTDFSELEELADKCEEIGEEVGGVSFPGMYG